MVDCPPLSLLMYQNWISYRNWLIKSKWHVTEGRQSRLTASSGLKSQHASIWSLQYRLSSSFKITKRNFLENYEFGRYDLGNRNLMQEDFRIFPFFLAKKGILFCFLSIQFYSSPIKKERQEWSSEIIWKKAQRLVQSL